MPQNNKETRSTAKENSTVKRAIGTLLLDSGLSQHSGITVYTFQGLRKISRSQYSRFREQVDLLEKTKQNTKIKSLILSTNILDSLVVALKVLKTAM